MEDSHGGVARIRAKVFIDSTGEVWLARAIGCETVLGVDPRSRFNEPSPPEEGFVQLNAITRCYMIVPERRAEREPAPRRRSSFPCGVRHRLDGRRADGQHDADAAGKGPLRLSYEECMRRSEQIVRVYWHWLQQVPEFQGYELAEIAPMLGIRESHRLVARYVLNEHDVTAGLPNQQHPDIIAVADHPCDIHGAGGGLVAVNTAYGIPYRCLIPAGAWENLLVACRGAGFSKIAASSVRLQRTMIQLGHAAGMAAAMAVKAGAAVDRIDVKTLVERLDARGRYPIEESFVFKDNEAAAKGRK